MSDLCSMYTRYNAFLADRLNTDMETLESLAQEYIRLYPSKPAEPVEEKEPEKKVEVTSSGRCTYLLRSGKNKGSPCGSKESVAGSCRCKTHAGKDQDTPVPAAPTKTDKPVKEFATSVKTPAKVSKAVKKANDIGKMENQAVVKAVQAKKNTISIQKNEFGNYIHSGTSLIWDRDSLTVTGRQMPNGSILPLSENDIQLCIANGWKYKSEMKSNQEPRQFDNQIYDSDVSESDSDEDEYDE